MAEFWQAVHIRGQQTLGVWGTFSASFQVGSLTLALHTADVALILTQVNERDVHRLPSPRHDRPDGRRPETPVGLRFQLRPRPGQHTADQSLSV